MSRLAVVLVVLLFSGCSSIIEGTSQQIMVNTNPPGADCGLYREGVRIATIQNSPGSALIGKTKHDVWVVCVKQGFQLATYFDHSGAAGATFGNIILGGGIGWAIDSASGEDNQYQSPLNITLVAETAGASSSLPVLPAMFTGPSSQQ
jgi:uncharacterized protein YceK